MKKLLIATSNPAKREEITLGLQNLVSQGLEILTLKDVTIKGEPVESGSTFEENAKIKAQFYAAQTELPTLSDDGGLMIDALGGAPGVKSRRWPGYEATDKELIQYALDHMKDVPDDDRTAQLVTCVCFFHNGTWFCEQEGIQGILLRAPSTWDTNGYPFRALFKVLEFNKMYDELTRKEHDKVNHRLIALKRLEKPIMEQIMV